ncbi:MAG: DUF3147 family protein [Cocleimonas sp.]
MNYYIIKIVITTILIVAISEISKRSSLIGAILASVPLVSVIAMIWLYQDTKDISKISELSFGIFWLVIPSLALFLSLPVLLKQGINFYLSLVISITITVACYYLMIIGLKQFGIKL